MPRTIPMLCLAAFAALAACSSPQPASEAADSSVPTNAVEVPASPLPEQEPADAPPVAPTPGELETFRDWTVGCDNLKHCKAVALAPEGDIGEWPALMLSVERDAGADGALRITLAGQGEAVPPIAIAVDGRRVANGGSAGDPAFAGEDARRIAAALVDGASATIVSKGVTSTVSLAGVAAALRYIDAQQTRAGTTGALVARGPAPDRSVATPAPVIRLGETGGTPAALTPAMIESMRATAACEVFEGIDMGEPETASLGGGKTLALVPCSRGAYNLTSSVFIIEDGEATPAAFDVPTGMNPDARVPSVVNGAFEDGILTSYAKARGLGDCGVRQSLAWDGTRFRLSEQSEIGECRGRNDYITTWRARVVR